MAHDVEDPQDARRRAASLLGWLTGDWSIDRDINGGGGTFVGRAAFTPQADGTLRWHETGELTLDGATVPTYRTLSIDAAGQVRFDDGRPFHVLALVDGACDAFHPCAPDEYEGRYVVVDDDTFDVTWRVRGPGRDDTIISRYARSRRPASVALSAQ
jgi:hypothetical protein